MRVLFRLLVFLPCVRTQSAAEPAFRFFTLPPVFFTPEETATFPKDGQVDAAALLKKRGLELPAGSVASYDAPGARLYLKAAQRDYDLMERLIEDIHIPAGELPYEPKQVRLTAICYAIPVTAVPDSFKATSELSELDEKKLKVIDRRSLLVRGGQRAKSENIIPLPAPADPDAETPPPRDKRMLEAEATVGEDGDTIDLNLALELRTPDLAPAGSTAEFTLSTQALMHNKSRIIHELGVTAETEPRLVIWEVRAGLEAPSARQPAQGR
jgi:hypothetical protein